MAWLTEFKATVFTVLDELGFDKEAAMAPSMMIGEVADLTGLTPRTIRYYEAQGFVLAHRSGRFRLYGSKDVAMLRLIKILRETGSGIGDISELVSRAEKADSLTSMRESLSEFMHRQYQKQDKELERCKQRKEACRALIDICEGGRSAA